MGNQRVRLSPAFLLYFKMSSCIKSGPILGDRWNKAQITGLENEDEGYDSVKNPKTAMTRHSPLLPGGHGAVKDGLAS